MHSLRQAAAPADNLMHPRHRLHPALLLTKKMIRLDATAPDTALNGETSKEQRAKISRAAANRPLRARTARMRMLAAAGCLPNSPGAHQQRHMGSEGWHLPGGIE